jgi:hypothetical protein
LVRPRKSPAQTELLAEAADLLDEAGKPQHADAVRDALAEISRPKAREDLNPTLPVYVRTTTWRAAQQAGAVPKAIEEGFAALLAGRFTPPEPTRGGGRKSSYSGRAPRELQDQVAEYVTKHAKKLKWSPSPGQVAAAWLEHQYGAESGT